MTLEMCAKCGWLEPKPDHRCMVVERSPLFIDPVPVEGDDLAPSIPRVSEAAALGVIVRLRLERDALERQVADLQQQVGDLEEQLAQRVGLGIDVAADRIEQLEAQVSQSEEARAEVAEELARRDAKLGELENLVAVALDLEVHQ